MNAQYLNIKLKQNAVALFLGVACFLTLPLAAQETSTEPIKTKSDKKLSLTDKGYAKEREGQYAQAIALYNQAIKQNPKDPEAYFRRGNVNLLRHEYDGAIEDFSKTILSKPKNSSAFINRGISYDRKKRVCEGSS